MWWEETEEFFGLANLYPSWMIETEHSSSGSPDRCATDHMIPFPTTMCMPVIHTRMKQRNLISRVRVAGFNAVGLL